jgi:hypothetical protein
MTADIEHERAITEHKEMINNFCNKLVYLMKIPENSRYGHCVHNQPAQPDNPNKVVIMLHRIVKVIQATLDCAGLALKKQL